MSEDVPFIAKEPGPSHYYGDIVRAIFVVIAILILLSNVVGAAFLEPSVSLIAAFVLAIAAGLANPVQASVQWLNVLISAAGLLLSGNVVLRHLDAGDLLDEGIVVLGVSIGFLIALYYAVKSLRGVLMRDAPVIK